MARKIESLTAYVMVGADGEEGVMGMLTPNGFVAMIGANDHKIRQLYPIALQAARDAKCEFRVLHFSVVTDVTQETRKKYSGGN